MRAKEAFLLQVKATHELLLYHKKQFPRKPGKYPASSHILRAVIVFLIAAVDAYVHKRIIEVVRRKLKFSRTISNAVMERMTKGFFDRKETDEKKSVARFTNLIKLAIHERYYEKLTKLLEERISHDTFQKSGQLTAAFKLMYITDGWKEVTKHFYAKNKHLRRGPKPKLDLVLNGLADRRDIIVHQGDMHFGKKYGGEFRSISRSALERDFKVIYKLLLSIEEITEKI